MRTTVRTYVRTYVRTHVLLLRPLIYGAGSMLYLDETRATRGVVLVPQAQSSGTLSKGGPASGKV
jgi:hypothetical protein